MRSAHTLAIALLSAVAIGHILRLLFQWEIIFNQMTIPMWPSVFAVFVFLGAAIALWREHRHRAA